MEDNMIHIKNMVCNRCIMVVRERIENLGFKTQFVELGSVVFSKSLTNNDIALIKAVLEPIGFELIDDKYALIIEQVKNAIIELVHKKNGTLKMNLSDYLVAQLHHDYSYISNLFSELENTTIEKYFIAQKIERVKELLVYNELSLAEIADLLNYSSTAHLSAQFKKVTGLTPSHFKKIKDHKRKSLDQV